MKSNVIKFFLRKQAAAKTSGPNLVHADLIMHVAIVAVYEENEKFAWVDKYVKEWRKRGMKSVHFYLFFPRKQSIESFDATNKDWAFTASDISWRGGVKKADLAASLASSCDVLIDLSRGKSVYCDAVIANSQAKWKAGEHSDERTYLLDFMIDSKGDVDIRNLIHHLDNYLTQFNISKP